MDYYPQHLFIRVLIHNLANDDTASSNNISHLPRSDSPTPMEVEDDDLGYEFGKIGRIGESYDVDDEQTADGREALTMDDLD